MVGGFSSGGSIGGAGGWLAGGGHSALAPIHGLGIDNALEISAVLSTGEFLVTNNYQNSDLFWASRGGGGSTYGIVTSVTYRTYSSVSSQLYFYQANITNSSTLLELVGGLLRFQTQFTDDGWGGYGLISNQQVLFLYLGLNMTNETVTTTTQAWKNYTASLEPFGVTSSHQTSYSSSFYEMYQILFNGSSQSLTGANLMVSSRLPVLSRDTVSNKYAQVAKVPIDCNGSLNMVAGGKVNKIAADSAGLNPAWRNTVAESVCVVGWDDGATSTEINDLISQLKGWIKTMHDLTPNDGAYFNEASLFEIDWQQTFFGTHHSKLKDIKNKYDPHRLFVVGSDEWNANLTCWN